MGFELLPGFQHFVVIEIRSLAVRTLFTQATGFAVTLQALPIAIAFLLLVSRGLGLGLGFTGCFLSGGFLLCTTCLRFRERLLLLLHAAGVSAAVGNAEADLVCLAGWPVTVVPVPLRVRPFIDFVSHGASTQHQDGHDQSRHQSIALHMNPSRGASSAPNS